MKMGVSILFILCTQLLAISLHHHVIHSKGITIQQLRGVEGVEADGDKAVQVKYELKLGKGTYGGANMNHDPRAAKGKASSSHVRRDFFVSIGISIGVGFLTPLLFGF